MVLEAADGGTSAVKVVALYIGMIAVAVGLLLYVNHLGKPLIALEKPIESEAFGVTVHSATSSPLVQVLAALLVVLASARLVGALLARIGQPPVMGEIVAGLLLGPSFLGRLWPVAESTLFPRSVTDFLGIAAQGSVVVFMFLVGLDLSGARLRTQSHVTIAISHASIVLPLVLGGFLALYLYPRYASPDVPFTAFALFTGVALSVTAFPVLARILTDRGMQTTRLGAMALACAAVDDASAWCLLALLTSVVQADLSGVLRTSGLTVAYVLLMFLVTKRWLRYLAHRSDVREESMRGTITLVFLTLILSALATEWIGIHALFGAFLVGVLTPEDSRLATLLRERLEEIVVTLALPAFFAFSGLRTQLGLVNSPRAWLDVLLVVAVATAGKFGGTFVSGWLVGLSRRDASVLGILMNTRGLMELIVLNVGLDLGVLSRGLFAILVLMAVLTTMATTPMLALLTRRAPIMDK